MSENISNENDEFVDDVVVVFKLCKEQKRARGWLATHSSADNFGYVYMVFILAESFPCQKEGPDRHPCEYFRKLRLYIVRQRPTARVAGHARAGGRGKEGRPS